MTIFIMKATEQYCHVQMFIMLCKLVLADHRFEQSMVTIQMKAIEQFFHVVLFMSYMLYSE